MPTTNNDQQTNEAEPRRGGRLEKAKIEMIHKCLPKPVGKGQSWTSDPSSIMADGFLLGTIMAVGNRVDRGAIPFPLEDYRCSYCFICHDGEDNKPLKCSKCRKVYYCNKECQRNHWKLHKKVCGTVTETWVEEEHFFADDDDVADEHE